MQLSNASPVISRHPGRLGLRHAGRLALRHPGGLALFTSILVAIAGCTGDVPPTSQPGAADAPFAARTALYEVFVRDFSPEGTFRGVIDGLDRIQATGAEVVWLMPIHPVGEKERKGTLGSSYSVRNYLEVNPNYGTKEDFRALVEEVHARGMKVILDWVPNHTAWDNVWISEHPEYYARNAAGEMTHPREPGGNLTDWTDVAELEYDNPGLRAAMIDALRLWVESFDIDGYRVDVAGFIPASFYQQAIPELRSIKPVLMLAEWDEPWLLEAGFDLMYPWASYGRLKEVWNGGDAASFVRSELEDLATFPPGTYRMRMTTNHDETAWDKPPVTLFGGSAGARAAFVAMALLPGPPLLYNGQEVESPQTLPLFEKEPIEWDQPNADESRAFYRQVIELSRTNPSLVEGDLEIVTTNMDHDVIAYRRNQVVVLVNTRPQPAQVTVEAPIDGSTDLLRGTGQQGNTVSLPGYGAVVLSLKE